MSEPFGLDNGEDPAENPEPEEDSDWSQTDHVRNTEPQYFATNQQGEDPEDISEIGGVETPKEDENVVEEVVFESESAVCNSVSSEVQCRSNDNASHSVAEEEDEKESASSCLVEGDSFEQDEQMAAPESENEVIQQTCSESDQQLLGVQPSAASEENVCVDLPEANTVCNGAGGFNTPPISASDNNTSEDNVVEVTGNENPHIFSGDVQVDVSNDVDAPEDEFRIGQDQSLAEESAALLPECGRVSVSDESPAIESQRLNENQSDIDRDSQVPECDRNGEGDVSVESPESNLQVGSHITESVSSEIHVEGVQECEENQISPEKRVENNGNCENSEQFNGLGAFASLTDSSPIHSSEDQSKCEQKGNSNQLQVEICQEDKDSAASFSPSHSESQSEHSSKISPTHQSSSNRTDSAIAPINSSNSTNQQASTEDSYNFDSVTSSNSKTKSPSPLPTDNITQNTSTAITSESHVTDSFPNGSLKSDETPTNAATNLHSSLTAETTVPKEEPENVSESSFHSKTNVNKAATLSDKNSRLAQVSPDDIQKQLALALSNDDEDDLDDIMSELDAELLSRSSRFSPQRFTTVQKSLHDSDLLHTSSTLSSGYKSRMVNGVIGIDVRQLQDHNRQLLEQLKIRDSEIKNLCQERDSTRAELTKTQTERDKALTKASSTSNHNPDDLYLPQIKELENTIVQQQKEIQATKDKLLSHDTAAKKAVTTLQNELKNRVDQVTKLYEDVVKEKDSMVVMFAASESKVMETKRTMERLETRLKDATREKESLISTLKTAKTDKQKAVNSYEQKCSEMGNLQREMEKLKEALSSSDYRIKWFQNKLKEELDTHKETKSNLEKTTSKLKETKEETEIIRRECQAIVKTYQESEEIKSNSLDKELKIKESQLKLHMQEWSDTEEIHQRTKKELDSIKAQHKETVTQVATLKEKVHGLETTLAEKETAIAQSNELLNKQKADITDMTSKLKEKQALDEDFNRAQEMIKNLDKDVSELKISNRDLQKDMDSCRERESKMLALQSELSRTNACLRSENTTLSNKATNQTAEVERLKMEIQELETTVKHLTDSVEDEKKNNSQTLVKLKTSLEEKTKESSDFKQKWEDEIDNNKTLKRRHANNVKDLTRQLQQTKRRLEVLEGNRKDSGGSMGSRTNSNGSLNSMENSHAGMATAHHQHPPSGTAGMASAPSQDFPVITEQVEIDKQVLIERIVRLQKSHARKNEKLEFLGEHIQQLLEEIKKKTKIIQSYIMREEAGTLSSEDMDANKAEARKEMQSLLSRKGGIMASVYSLHQQDGNMTLELSLQINKKLQAVLEDTLLKNITLKENLDTLGEEIARLSQVNRKLQLHLQDLENSKRN